MIGRMIGDVIRPKSVTYAKVKGPDGKIRSIGRVDNKLWAPKAWFYRYITFPYLARKYKEKV